MTKALELQLQRKSSEGDPSDKKFSAKKSSQSRKTGKSNLPGGKRKNTVVRWARLFVPLGILVLAFWIVFRMFSPAVIDTSEGLELLRNDKAVRAVVNDVSQTVNLTLKSKYHPKANTDSQLTVLPQLSTKSVTFTYSRAQAEQVDKLIQNSNAMKKGFNSLYPVDNWVGVMLQMLIPLALFAALLMWGMNRIREGGMMNFGKSKFRALDGKAPKVKFDDVAGEDEAVEELREIQEFLSEPDKFHKLGARIPKGVLLCGPPGTGKTLLAKAVAGEAQVPFFSLSGSEFVETFVGVGASRVRDLFAQAKENAPSIVFVDEIDAVGRHRGAGMGGGNDEREQTLNQLLVEMDGFDSTTNVILIAATNRPDVLDPALLRPGRFDRQINVEAPDMKGRVAILKVHANGKPMTMDVDLENIAKRTPGFTGADLENVLNEAALLTARAGGDLIDNRALDEAIDRVIAGPQKRTRVMKEHDKLVTAYHEAGHAICAAAQRYSDPVTKVTILPRGRALGYTMVMPTEDRYNRTRNQLLDELVYMMGGRVAEELIFEDPSTGASNDLQKATKVARRLVTDFGMSNVVGPVKLGEDENEPFLGRQGISARDYSEQTAALVDQEVRQLLDQANREAWEILSRNRQVLDDLSARLMEKETLLEEELKEIFSALQLQAHRPTWSYGREAAVSEEAIGNPISYRESIAVSATLMEKETPVLADKESAEQNAQVEETVVSPIVTPPAGTVAPTALTNPVAPEGSAITNPSMVPVYPNSPLGATTPNLPVPTAGGPNNLLPGAQPGGPIFPPGTQGPRLNHPGISAPSGSSTPVVPPLGPTPSLRKPATSAFDPDVTRLGPVQPAFEPESERAGQTGNSENPQ